MTDQAVPQNNTPPVNQNDLNNALDFIGGQVSPTNWQVAKSSAENGFNAAFSLGSNLLEKAGLITGESNSAQQAYETNNVISSAASGVWQNTLGAVSNIAGSILNPLTDLSGGVASYGAVKLGANIVDRIPGLSSTISKYAPTFLAGGSAGATVTAPQAFDDNYSAESNKLDVLGAAKELGIGTGLGFALSSVPIAYAMAKAKGVPIDVKTPEEADNFVNSVNTNESVKAENGFTNFNVANESDVDNFTSVLSNMVTNDQPVDPNVLRSMIQNSSANIYNDPVMKDVIDNAASVMDNIHQSSDNAINDLISNGGDLEGSIKSALNIGDNETDVLNKYTQPFSPESEDLMSLDKSSLNEDDQANIDKAQQLASLRMKLAKSQEVLGFVKKMQSLFQDNYDPDEGSSKINQYLEKGYSDQSGVDVPDEPVEPSPDYSNVSEPSIQNALKDNDAASESLGNKEIFQKLVRCVMGGE